MIQYTLKQIEHTKLWLSIAVFKFNICVEGNMFQCLNNYTCERMDKLIHYITISFKYKKKSK